MFVKSSIEDSLARRWLRPTHSIRVCSPPSRRLATLGPRLRGADGLDDGSAHARTGSCRTKPNHEPTHGDLVAAGWPRWTPGGDRRRSRARLDQGTKHLAGYVAFQAAHDLLLRQPLAETTLHVGFRALVGAHTRDDHHVQR